MNIFYCDTNITACAAALDDVRLNKMILETAQLLSTAIHLCSEGKIQSVDIHSKLYRITHKNHPCSKWTRESLGNYAWLYAYFNGLMAEYIYRKQKEHACGKLLKPILLGSSYMPDTPKTPHPNCTIYKDEPNTIEAYRKYLCYKWEQDKIKGRPPKWTKQIPPVWYSNYAKQLYT